MSKNNYNVIDRKEEIILDNAENMLKLAKLLSEYEIVEKKGVVFDMAYYYAEKDSSDDESVLEYGLDDIPSYHCGTACCALGSAPMLKGLAPENYEDWLQYSARLFVCEWEDNDTWSFLFDTCWDNDPIQAAKRLVYCAKNGEEGDYLALTRSGQERYDYWNECNYSPKLYKQLVLSIDLEKELADVEIELNPNYFCGGIMERESHIILNKIRTPDGTELISHHRYDYKEHKDEITGETYMVDGGTAYLRRTLNKVKATELSVYDTDDYDLVRRSFMWGSYGINGDEPLHWILLEHMSDGHIDAVLLTQIHLEQHIKDIFNREIEYRKFMRENAQQQESEKV